MPLIPVPGRYVESLVRHPSTGAIYALREYRTDDGSCILLGAAGPLCGATRITRHGERVDPAWPERARYDERLVAELASVTGWEDLDRREGPPTVREL